MNTAQPSAETDPRFPSGKWVGFWVQKCCPPGKYPTELILHFSQGEMTGEARDWPGESVIRGQYSTGDGRCHWHKQYVGKHDVYYEGYNEGKGIWGTWTMSVHGEELRGGFHIWPEGMANPTQDHLAESADLPAPVEEKKVEKAEPVAVPG